MANHFSGKSFEKGQMAFMIDIPVFDLHVWPTGKIRNAKKKRFLGFQNVFSKAEHETTAKFELAFER